MIVSHPRPHNVNAALMLLWIALGIGALLGLVRLFSLPSPSPYTSLAMVRVIGMLTLLFTIGLDVLLIFLIGKRMNWARVVYLILFLLGIPLFLYGQFNDPARGLAAIAYAGQWLPLIGRGLALWLLFGPPDSRDWFAGRLPPAAATAATTDVGQQLRPVRVPSHARTPAPGSRATSQPSRPASAIEGFAAGREEGLTDAAAPVAAATSNAPAGPSANAPVAASAATAFVLPTPGSRADLRRRFDNKTSNFRVWLTLFWIDFGIGLIALLLFANKVRQTSETALRYSRQTHEQVGEWTLTLAMLFLCGVVLLIAALVSRGNRNLAREHYAALLRRDLGEAKQTADISAQVDCESELRRLGR